MASIDVALSGGGYRATVWALGALLYLVDAGKNLDGRWCADHDGISELGSTVAAITTGPLRLSVGHARQHLNLLGYALMVNGLALHRYQHRAPDQLAA